MEEKKDVNREERSAEADGDGPAAGGQGEVLGQECLRLGRLAVHIRCQLAQQAKQVKDQKETLERARRAWKLAEGDARKLMRELTEVEGKMKTSEEAQERAKVDTQI